MCNNTVRLGRAVRSIRSTCVYLFSAAPTISYTVIANTQRQGTINDIAQAFIELDGGRVGRTHEEVHKIAIVHLFTHLPSATFLHDLTLPTWLDTLLKMKTQQKPGSKATRKDENEWKWCKMTTTSIFGIEVCSLHGQYSDSFFRIESGLEIPLRFPCKSCCVLPSLPSSSKYSMSLLATPVRRNSGATEMAETCPCQLGWVLSDVPMKTHSQRLHQIQCDINVPCAST